MAISSWMIRNRSIRKNGRPPPEECYILDKIKSPSENSYDIYLSLSSRMTTENKRLSLLNALVKLLEESKGISLGFTTEEFLYCVSASLTHQFTQIRAGALRAIRYLITVPKDIQTFNGLQLPHLVCRSLDILLKNEEERVQALKLVRKMLAVSPDLICPVLVRCLVALGESGIEHGDRMLRACLACLCEFGVLNPTLLIVCGGVSAIKRNVLECHSPRIAESLCGVLLHLLEWPHTRNMAGVRLDCLAAPYCDFTYRLGIMDKNKDARDLRFTCSRLALLSVLRSWAGTIEFCDPNKPSGLKAIVDVLYLNQLEVRKAILDLLYELLGLPQPVWTDEYSVALQVVDPADYQDGWRLGEGFVALEGRFVLPSLANRVPNICEIHLAVLLYCFLETGLLNALVEVIVSSDTFLSVRATVLLGKILHLMHTLLPADICGTSPALPTLISKATEGNHQARAAISALQSFQQMLKNRPASCSLFLDNVIQSGTVINSKVFKREINTQENIPFPMKFGTLERRRHNSVGSSSLTGEPKDDLNSSFTAGMKRTSLKRNKLFQFFDGMKESEKFVRLSNVLLNQDGSTWDWDIIVAIFRSEILGKLDDTQTRFIKRIVHYFKPGSNRFSHQDLGHGRHIPASVTAGIELIDWLLQSSQELECVRLLTDLFTDISTQLLAITTFKSAHDCLFSPQHMMNTMCQQYFVFIGRMCKTEKGLGILKNTDVFKQLLNIVLTTHHICYVKLIVSGLDYTLDALPRLILDKALTSSLRPGRIYATQFLLVLLRAKIVNFEVWGIPMLIKQTKDKERGVVLTAFEILEEACHHRPYLEELVNIWPKFDTEDDTGRVLETRFYSIPRGLNHSKAQTKDEILFWLNGFNKKYVLLVEASTHSSLTLHTKSEDGTYNRRSCSTSRPTTIPPNIFPHLYGQLVQTTQGMQLLQKFGDLPKLIETLTATKLNNESDSLLLKSAMWALGHISTSTEGVEFLNDPVSRIYEKLIFLAKNCEIYSIRGTALNVLGLVGSTNAGANVLYKLDWFCVRHDRNTFWPVCEPEDWLSKHLSPVRHHIGEMPPYNYTGIDENISGFFNSSEGFYFDENGDSMKDIKEEDQFDGGEISNTTRSRTMPMESVITRPTKHVRSLSESKTSDGLSLLIATNSHRTRFNSGTDSNTSGVSSCDSVAGRNIIGDLQQTLSPIPSSSNLLEIKKEGRFRRTSLTGVSLRENTLTPQDLQGYATLRSLRRHCRPMLSESAADELADIIEVDTVLRSNKLGIGDQQRKLKVRSLDRQCSLISSRIDEFQTSGRSASKILQQNDTRGPCYSGICLPKNILDLFPQRNITGTYVSHYVPEVEVIESSVKQYLNDSIIEGDESCVSSMSDISSNSKRSKWIGKHNRSNCLHCCRSKINRLHPRTDSEINIHRRKSHHSSSIQLSDVSFNSPESVFSDESMPDRVTGTILRHVQRMANPVWMKQSKMALLDLKQKHPLSFQDICLYSEICKSLGRNTYRLIARRFLQEIFLDLDFDSFYNESSEIINRKDKEKETSSSICSGDDDMLFIREDFIANHFPGNIELSIQIQPPYNLIKSHLKSPPLASLVEASAENLSESFGTTTKLQNSALSKNCDQQNQNDKENILDEFSNENFRRSFTRTRRYTLELDLSCTKNKFPITDRRKKDFSPTFGQSTIFSSSYTKSGVTTPTGSLYCEKRLNSSKSEATLSKCNEQE